MSGHQIKQFVCLVFCFFFAAAAAAASAESMQASAADLQPESVSGAETPAIEDDFWLNGDYMLSVLRDGSSGELRVEIFMEEKQTGNQVLWVFPCEAGSKPDSLLSHTCTMADNTYDEDNLLVQNVYPDQACEARFILNEKDQVTVSGTSDARLDGRVFSRPDESRIESGELFLHEKGQEWWLDVPFESWVRLRPVWLDSRNWFWVHQLPRNVYAIFEPYQDQSVISYLIPGEKSALLWDTGMGISDIRKCVEQLTDLPVTVLNSHDHFDHTGGNYLFENVMCYNTPSAVRTLTEGQTHLDLLEYVDPKRIINMPKDFNKDHFRRIGKAPTATVEDGQVIDLGGRKLEVMYTPGHSVSSIMLIDEANGLLFSGDTWYPGPLYAFLKDSSLPDYVASMRRAEKVIRERNIDWIYPSHNEVLPGTDLFFETADFLQDVLDGKISYEIDEGKRCYTMNSIVSLYMNPEETGN